MTGTQGVHAPLNNETRPLGDLCIRTLAMPADTNQNGDIFGGWLLSQMDIGGSIFASKIANSRTVTVAIEAMNFRKPVYVGDLVSVHATLVKIGKTSITYFRNQKRCACSVLTANTTSPGRKAAPTR